MESCLALSMDPLRIRPPPRIRQPAKDDSNCSIDEEVEAVYETDSKTYCRVGQLATGCLQGSSLTSSRILAPSWLKISSVYFEFLVVMTVYTAGGNYVLGSAIVESKAVNGCGERRRFGITDEG